MEPNYNNKFEIYFQNQISHRKPDYLKRFATVDYTELMILNTQFYNIIRTSDSSPLFLIEFMMDGTNQENQVSYETSIDIVSQLGAFVSVLFAAGCFYAMSHN